LYLDLIYEDESDDFKRLAALSWFELILSELDVLHLCESK